MEVLPRHTHQSRANMTVHMHAMVNEVRASARLSSVCCVVSVWRHLAEAWGLDEGRGCAALRHHCMYVYCMHVCLLHASLL